MKDFLLQRKGRKSSLLSSQNAFTLIEALIVVAILAILAIILLFNYQRHLMRARDARRKTDLEKIKIAFEEYYNDHRCYPPPHMLENCGTEIRDNIGTPGISGYRPYLVPHYLKEIPCDPLTKEHYRYESLEGSYCGGYRLLAKLEINTDKDITAIGCNFEAGCGVEEDPAYNWGIAVGASMIGSNWEVGGEGETVPLYYCTPVVNEPYECIELTANQRSTYFEPNNCQNFINYNECYSSCSLPEIPAGVACVCKNPPTYEIGCQ